MDLKKFLIDGTTSFKISEHATRLPDVYESREDYMSQLEALQLELAELQSMLYAQGQYGVIVLFQAMDAAGKDGTIKAVFNQVNPIGLGVYSFKRPTEIELKHDYLWRINKQLPERGAIRIFNRSYYEEVLVVKVHPEIAKNYQNLPEEVALNPKIFEKRYDDIRNYEKYLRHNGYKLVKIFLNVSKDEQAGRLIERIKDPSKNWKFEETDVKERDFWNQYMAAYEEAIQATAKPKNPWYVVPADDKKNMRLIVAKIVKTELELLSLSFPETTLKRHDELQKLIQIIESQGEKP